MDLCEEKTPGSVANGHSVQDRLRAGMHPSVSQSYALATKH